MSVMRHQPVQRTDIAPKKLLKQLGELTAEEADEYGFGIVRIDDEGFVTLYNHAQSEFAGTVGEDVIGKNFFLEVAPCTNNGLFRGAFQRGIETGELDEFLPYTFTVKMNPTAVRVRLYRTAGVEGSWMFCKPV